MALKELRPYLPVFIVVLVYVFVFSGFLVLQNVGARTSNSGNEIVKQEEADRNQLGRVTIPTISAATGTVLVDMNATSFFQHYASGSIEVSRIEVECSTKTQSTTTIKFGVITEAGVNTQKVSYFDSAICVAYGNSAGNVSNNTSHRIVKDYFPNRVRLSLSGATTTRFTSDEVYIAETFFPSNQVLRSPAAYVVNSDETFAQFRTSPERGDFVAKIADQIGTGSTTITYFYGIER